MPQPRKLKLYGFNNLTKALSFNAYDVCYAGSAEQQAAYIRYIDETYDSERLTHILHQVTEIIGAEVLNVARQDYDPQGASVTMLVAEEPMGTSGQVTAGGPGPLPAEVVAHLDKSHIAVHTYPERHPHNGIATFRTDIDVVTCGEISPLKALSYLIHSLESDIVTLDYRVRGCTRDTEGRKHFIDHDITSIQNYLTEQTRREFQMVDVNVYQENLFHTKMRRKAFHLDDYLFAIDAADLPEAERDRIRRLLRREMAEIFHGRNLPPDIDL